MRKIFSIIFLAVILTACGGSGGSSSGSSKAPTPTNGAVGPAHGNSFSSVAAARIAGLCDKGTVAGEKYASGKLAWTCKGSNGGKDAAGRATIETGSSAPPPQNNGGGGGSSQSDPDPSCENPVNGVCPGDDEDGEGGSGEGDPGTPPPAEPDPGTPPVGGPEG